MTRARRNILQRRDTDRTMLRQHEIDFMETGFSVPTVLEKTDRSALVHALWPAYEATALAEYIKVHPGRRPWAWWIVCAPEGRCVVGKGGRMVAAHDIALRDGEDDLSHFGKACCWRVVSEGQGEVYETQFEYLNRLDLLGKGEEAQVQHATS